MASMDQFGSGNSDDIRRKMAMALLMQGMDTSPIKSWTQGAARLAQSLAGNIQLSRLEDERSQALSQIAPLLSGMGGQSPGSATPSSQPPPRAQQSSATDEPSELDTAQYPYGPVGAPNTPASIRTNNPGAQWAGPVASQFGATGNVGLPGGNNAAVFPDPGSGAAAQFALLGQKYSGMPLNAAIQKWSGGNSSPAYTNFITQQTGLQPQTPLTPEVLSGPQGLALAKAQAQWEAGRPYPLGDAAWKEAQARGLGTPPEEALPPGAKPAQYAGNRPAPVQAPQPAPQGQDIRAQIGAMLASKNPTTQEIGAKLGMTLLQQQLQPAELKTLKDMTGQDVPYWARPSDQTLTPATVPGQAGPMATSGDVSQDYESRYPGVNARVEQMYRGEGAMPNGRTNPIDRAAMLLIQQKHPDWNMTLWKAKNDQQVDFAKGKAAANIKSLNTVIGHMGDLKEDYDALGNVSGVPLANQTVNDVKNWYAGRSGEGPIKKFDLSRNAVSDELARVFRETGTMSDTEVHQWKGTIDSSHSVPQQKAVIGRGLNLLESRLNAINDQWTRLHPGESFPILSDSSKQKLNKLREWANSSDNEGSTVPTLSGWAMQKIK